MYTYLPVTKQIKLVAEKVRMDLFEIFRLTQVAASSSKDLNVCSREKWTVFEEEELI